MVSIAIFSNEINWKGDETGGQKYRLLTFVLLYVNIFQNV